MDDLTLVGHQVVQVNARDLRALPQTQAIEASTQVTHQGQTWHRDPSTSGTFDEITEDVFGLHGATRQEILRHRWKRAGCAGRRRCGTRGEVFVVRAVDVSSDRKADVVA